jgi:light-independent protochlorophyllide reductase subunit B
LPYGEAGTTRFLRELCALCEIPAERIAVAARDAKLLWYSRTVDAHALSSKRVGVFGLPTAAAGIARVLRDELDMEVEFVGTYALDYGDWLRERVRDITENVIVTDDYREVARAIDRTRPDIVFGSQMERHSASGFGVPCANHIGDLVNQTQVLGLEHHLIETFGPRGQGRFAEAAPEPAAEPGDARVPVAAGDVATDDVRWDAAAERLLGRVPFFVRKKARANVEKYARERNIAVVDEAVMLRAREHVGG